MRGRVLPAAWAAVISAGCVGLLVSACGGQQSHSQRPAVARYITQAGQIEAQLATPLAAVTQAGAEFAQNQGGRHATSVGRLEGASDESALQHAWAQIQSLRRRLAAVPAPAPAARLRAMLLELTDLEARSTREVSSLVVFVPRFATALAPLGSATHRLEVTLSQPSASGSTAVAAAYASKATALRRFKRAVDGIRGRLEHLHPPQVSESGYRAQLAALAGMSATAAKLATVLDGGAQGDVQQLLTEFDRAALSTQSRAVQKAQIASIRAYDSQSEKLAELSTQIDRERQRLANTVQ
jgi:hypothetical protein